MTFHFFEDFLNPIITGSDDAAILYLQRIGLLKREMKCPACNVYMKIVSYRKHRDGKSFRCLNKSCADYSYYINIRKNSFFETFNLSLPKCIHLIWKWCKGECQNQVMKDLKVGPVVLIKFYDALRLLCNKYFARNPVRLGGEGVLCQIDESLFRHKPKYHKGRAPDHEIWVFGIADTSYTPARVFLAVAENRSAAGLYDYIFNVCRPGSVIWSDEWAAYGALFLYGYEHGTVNHSLEFVDSLTGVNTQAIESYWNKLKLRVKAMKGVLGSKIKDYLNEWMFKDMIYLDDWQNVIDLIKYYF